MTLKFKKVLLPVLALCFVACLLSACSFGPTLEAEKDRYDLTASVTYHANGGKFNNSDELPMYYKDGAYALDIGFKALTSGSVSCTYAKHTLVGWYLPKTDSEGNLVYKEDNVTVVVGEKFDFTVPLKEGDQIDLYALWVADQKVEVLLAAESSINDVLKYTYTNENGEKVTDEYKPGDVLTTHNFGTDGKVQFSSKDPVTGKSAPTGYVLAEYYYDAECKNPVAWPIESVEGEEEDLQIYALYLSSDWEIIKDATNFIYIFTKENNNGKYFIKNDINAENYVNFVPVKTNSVFGGEIRGNGYTVSNLKNIVQSSVADGFSVALFGRISSTAKITDLTIKDFEMEYTGVQNASIYAYFLSYGIDDGAVVSGVKIDGGKMSVTIYGGTFNDVIEPDKETVCPIVSGELSDGIEVVNAPEISVKVK